MNIFNKITNFLKGSVSEAKKVNWPSKKEVLKYTLVVLGLSVIMAMFLGGTDLVFTKLLNKVILQQ
ncbi:preprotein translocase subunit SecE [Candidatus Parcubacteria bacterium]|nr:preprotein translocase subunit SecE [Patescibacteria group bacterium]MBU4466602.1 preprotein translocase subunit SecE [Patescibacteria group bacterium]MCG2688689.1 preprotein translocase subunit SecE [Candidatus Parcubacteria bacterium]